jgi:aspartokinase
MNNRVDCGGLIEKGDHCLVEVLGLRQAENEACTILGRFGAAGITLTYLSVGNGADGTINMSFCVRTAELARHRRLLDDIRADFRPQLVAANAPVVILTLYGPHFLERTSLASRVFSALRADGIRPHTVGSSVNSISVVVGTHDRDTAVGCLRRDFIWPE